MRKPTKLPGLRRPPFWRNLSRLNFAAAAVILGLSIALQLGLLDGLLR